MRPSRRAQGVFLLVLLALSLTMLVEAWRIEGWPEMASAGAFPLLLAAVMAVSALWELGKWWRTPNRDGYPLRVYVSNDWLGLVALGAGFVALLPFFGFFWAGAGFLTGAVAFLQRGQWAFAALLGGAVSAVVYALFTWVFKVQLP